MNHGTRTGAARRPTARTNARAATRERLIESGRAAFARRGYDGASVRAITRDAGANLGSITYHFGSKQALYEEVLERGLAPLADSVAQATRSPGSALDRAEATVRAFFAHLAANPDLPQLMLQEIAAGKPAPPPVRRALGAVSSHLAAFVLEGQLAGEVRAGDPILLALSVVAQPVHLTLIHRIAREVVGVDPSDPAMRDRVVEHATRFARAGLAAHKETS